MEILRQVSTRDFLIRQSRNEFDNSLIEETGVFTRTSILLNNLSEHELSKKRLILPTPAYLDNFNFRRIRRGFGR